MKIPKNLHRLDVFHLTAEFNSFTKTANELNISASMVSQHIGKLETQLNTKLFNRSTRVVQLTESGRLLFQASKDIFDRLNMVLSTIDEAQMEPKGNITINAQSNFAQIYLIPFIKEFSLLYPDVVFELFLDDHVQDLRKESIDISFTVGTVENSDYYATKLKEFDIKFCASPNYLNNKETPKTLEDIKQHDCILLSVLKDKNIWSFYNADNKLETVFIKPKAITNSGNALKAMVQNGLGITIIPDFIIENSIKEGTLIELLPEYSSAKLSIYAVYHQQLHKSSFTIRTFVKFIKDKFNAMN